MHFFGFKVDPGFYMIHDELFLDEPRRNML